MVKIVALVGFALKLYKKSFISALLLWQGLYKNRFFNLQNARAMPSQRRIAKIIIICCYQRKFKTKMGAGFKLSQQTRDWVCLAIKHISSIFMH
jgi:hypothetical protein